MSDGERVYFWTDVWLGIEPLCTRTQRRVDKNMLGLRIAEYWEHDAGWKWRLLQDVLCLFDMVNLAFTTLALDSNRGDMIK